MALSKIDAANFLNGTIPSGNITTASLASAATGKVLQVVQTIKVDTFSSTSGGWIDVTGLSLAITPSATSSKVYGIFSIAMGLSNFNDFNYSWKSVRGSTDIGISNTGNGGSGGGNMYLSGGAYPHLFGNTKTVLDSPSTTSATTYKIQINKGGTDGTIYVNRRGQDSGQTAVSSITLMEIGA